MTPLWFNEDLMYEGPNPCHRGHNHGESGGAIRYLSNKNCVLCAKINCPEWQNANPDRASELSQQYRDRNRDAINQRRKELRAEDPEKYREMQRRYNEKLGTEEINRRARENYHKRRAALKADRQSLQPPNEHT